MYARVTTIEFSPEQPDEAAMIFDSVRPTLEELQGFKGLVMLSGVDSRSLVALTLWETAADLEAASPVLETVKEAHTHDPPQDHVIVMRSGRMRWTVEDQSLEAGPGDVIVTPAGTPHSYEVLGDEPARVVCVDSPPTAKPS